MRRARPVHVVIALSLGFATCENADSSDIPKAAELVELLKSRDSMLKSVALVYRQKFKGDRDGVTNGYVRRFIAAKAPRSFYRDNSHGHARLDWRQDPLRKILLISPDEIMVFDKLNRIILNPTIAIDHSAAPATVQRELLFRVLCWWPYADWDPPTVFGRPWSMTSLMASGEYVLRSHSEVWRNGECIVLEVPGVDELWIDASPPHCILRRDIFNNETGALAVRFEYRDYFQYNDTLWFFRTFRNQQFDSYAQPEKSQRRTVIDGVFEIKNLRANESVRDDDFSFLMAPGTVRRTVREGMEIFERVNAGQSDHVQSLKEWAASSFERKDQAGNLGVIGLWCFCGFSTGILAGFTVFYKRPNRRTIGDNEDSIRNLPTRAF